MHVQRFHPARAKGLLRRRWPRFPTDGAVSARIVTLDLDMPVRDVSYGGFCAESSMQFVPGEIHEFRVTPAGAASVSVRARATHSAAAGERYGQVLFRTGWEALGDRVTSESMAQLVAFVRRRAGDD